MKLSSNALPSSAAFKTNVAQHQAAMEAIAAAAEAAEQGGGPDARARHASRGKLIPRERVARLPKARQVAADDDANWLKPLLRPQGDAPFGDEEQLVARPD